ncbi:hypothetical protein ABZS29_18435 [Kribbella sp. NPDC005582]|uniref:hypothetical protein n=1 Tax=Kribbella sp. NPDC005582 TaxID=3156893 RepID=UPI0033BAECD4
MGAAQYARTTLGADTSPYDGRRTADSSPYDGFRPRKPARATSDHRRDANSQSHNELAGPGDAQPGPNNHATIYPESNANANADPNANSDPGSGPEFADARTDREHSVTDGVTRFGGGLLCGGWCPEGLCGMGAR